MRYCTGADRTGRCRDQTLAGVGRRSRAYRQACNRGELPNSGGGGSSRREAAKRECLQNRIGKALPRTCASYGGEDIVPWQVLLQPPPLAHGLAATRRAWTEP